MKQYLQFPEGTSEAELNRVRGAACKSIAKLHRSFKCNLVRNYVNEGKEPFELHKHLDRQDWEMFVETATSEQFKEKSEHFKNLRGVSSSRGWKEAFDKEHEGLWKKKETAICCRS